VAALLGLGSSAASASDAVNRFSAVDATADCATGVRYDGGNIHEGISTGHGADHGQ